MVWCGFHEARRKSGIECVACKEARLRAGTAALVAKRQKETVDKERETGSNSRDNGKNGGRPSSENHEKKGNFESAPGGGNNLNAFL